jgi:hypothetical protein
MQARGIIEKGRRRISALIIGTKPQVVWSYLKGFETVRSPVRSAACCKFGAAQGRIGPETPETS